VGALIDWRKTMRVINSFIDKKSGKQINPGDPLPPNISDERLRKLQRAGCIIIDGAPAQLLPDPPMAPAANAAAPAPKKRRSRKGNAAAAKEAAAPDGLFPGAGEGVSTAEGRETESGTAAASAAPVAGTDGGDSGAGAQLDDAGRAEGAEG
jgi:hypothetical protein